MQEALRTCKQFPSTDRLKQTQRAGPQATIPSYRRKSFWNFPSFPPHPPIPLPPPPPPMHAHSQAEALVYRYSQTSRKSKRLAENRKSKRHRENSPRSHQDIPQSLKTRPGSRRLHKSAETHKNRTRLRRRRRRRRKRRDRLTDKETDRREKERQTDRQKDNARGNLPEANFLRTRQTPTLLLKRMS